jgi:hypothetical protein
MQMQLQRVLNWPTMRSVGSWPCGRGVEHLSRKNWKISVKDSLTFCKKFKLTIHLECRFLPTGDKITKPSSSQMEELMKLMYVVLWSFWAQYKAQRKFGGHLERGSISSPNFRSSQMTGTRIIHAMSANQILLKGPTVQVPLRNVIWGFAVKDTRLYLGCVCRRFRLKTMIKTDFATLERNNRTIQIHYKQDIVGNMP